MARLLSPEQYGTFAILYLFSGIASCFADSGFSASLIQATEVSSQEKSSVFWFNVVAATVAGAILVALSPLIATFFDRPVLAGLTCGMALNVVVVSLGSVQSALFTKEMRFRPLMWSSVSGGIAGGVLGILLAWRGFGVWAILAQVLGGSVVSTWVLWVASEWRPVLCFHYKAMLRFFRFGGFVFLSALIDMIYNRFYTLLLGKYFGSAALGLYNRADQLQQLPAQAITSVISRITYPLFCEMQNEPEKLRSGVEVSIRSVMLVNVPAMFGLIVTADALVVVIFGEQWSESVPILRVLAFGGLFWPLNVINLSVLRAQGRSELFFRLEIIKKTVGAVILLLGAFWGVLGIAISVVACNTLSFFLNSWYTGKFLRLGAWAQLRICFPLIVLGFMMSIGVYLSKGAFGAFEFPGLCFQIGVGFVFWAIVVFALSKRRERAIYAVVADCGVVDGVISDD